MHIIEAKGTPNGRRVRVFLAEKGVTVEGVNIDLRAADNLSEAHRAKNPFGRIPVLELDDGSCIAESVAICRYFEETHPKPPLFGTDAKSRATVEMWNRRAELNFLMPVAQAFRNLTGFFKDREQISAEWGGISKEVAAGTLPLFDAALADAKFLAGEFSIADISFGCALDFAQAVKLDLPFDLPNISRYRADLAKRPSWSAR
ncbi:MAG: glutathione S-transferase family protein [Gammaproteobacteria bacterium]|nr:glutathione S-transferase family protein [Gammaproteobacteria bacterium]